MSVSKPVVVELMLEGVPDSVVASVGDGDTVEG